VCLDIRVQRKKIRFLRHPPNTESTQSAASYKNVLKIEEVCLLCPIEYCTACMPMPKIQKKTIVCLVHIGVPAPQRKFPRNFLASSSLPSQSSHLSFLSLIMSEFSSNTPNKLAN